MQELTPRQANILIAIVEAYAEVGHPVGSVTLAKLFKVSSSTIRGEMSCLEKLGFIKQPHTSAGRIPTDKGYRWYVNGLQEKEQEIENMDQFKAMQTRIKSAGEPDQAIRSALDSLVELTSNAAIGTLGPYLYTSGLTSLFSQPEFTTQETTQAVAYLLDNLENWLRETNPNQPVSVFIGKENPVGKASGCSLIISRFQSPYSHRGYIGIIGSTRQNYRQTMLLVEYAGQTLQKSF